MPDKQVEEITESFGDPQGEYDAARRGAALFDLAGNTLVELQGADRARFLHNFCTNDIRGLAAGQACEAFITNVQGKVLAHVVVWATAESLWLAGDAGYAERIISHLSRYQISEEVTFHDRKSETATCLLAGPQAPQVVGAIAPIAGTLATLRGGETQFDGSFLHVRRHDWLRVPGYFLVVPVSVARSLRDRLVEAGARPAGHLAFEALRIEAGFPRYGVDVTDANLAQEVGRTAQAVSFSKGCYLGQEPIARIDALGHVNQVLRGLKLAASRPPPAGAEVWTPRTEPKKVGTVTSSAVSYADQLPVALAILRRNFETPGQALEVRFDGTSVPAVVFWPSD